MFYTSSQGFGNVHYDVYIFCFSQLVMTLCIINMSHAYIVLVSCDLVIASSVDDVYLMLQTLHHY